MLIKRRIKIFNFHKGVIFMTFTNVNIKVPEGMTMYLKPQNAQVELERNALLLYPYINDKTISHNLIFLYPLHNTLLIPFLRRAATMIRLIQ